MPPTTPPNPKRILRRLLAYALPQKWWLISGIVAGVIGGSSIFGALMASPDVISTVTGKADAANTAAPPSALELIAARFDVAPRAADGSMTGEFVLFIMSFMALFLTLKAAAEFFNRYCLRRVGATIVCELRSHLFAHLQQQSLSYYSRIDVGDLVSRCTNDAAVIESSIANTITDLAKAPFDVAAALGFIAWTAYQENLLVLPIAMFIVLPVSMAPIVILGRYVRKYTKRALGRVGDLTSRMQENFTGIRVVKAFNTEAAEEARFAAANRGYLKQTLKGILASLAMNPLIQIAAIIASCAFLYYCFVNKIHLETIGPMAVAAFFCYEPMKKLGKINTRVQTMVAAATRIFEVLDVHEVIPEAPNAQAVSELADKVTVENLSFRYGPDRDPVLSDVSFEVPKGSLVALVGATGSGKSTLTNLIARFYDPIDGRITIDGIDLRQVESTSLRRLVGIVSQETILFNTSITDNIAYGSPDATRDQIMEAAKLAHAHDFIVNDAGGYDRVVGDKGFQLSGGQRQRLCIARAILRNPQILILDEATSALDTKTEQLVQSALDNLMQDRTVIAIAHRLSTIQHANQIIVLDHGRIVERGTHTELLAKDGFYAALHTMQHNGMIA